jgi:glycosidase
MRSSAYPSLYQINTRVLLEERGNELHRMATLDDVPDSLLDSLAAHGFEWVWFLGVWQTGEASRAVSRSNPEWRAEFLRALPDLTEDDISGSPYAVRAYTVHEDFGGDEALATLRARLASRGLKLMLDFVPNHIALDHPWVAAHPEFLIQGDEPLLAEEPQNYKPVVTAHGDAILAHGRDPYFPGWPDTFQLNYRHRGLRDAMIADLVQVAERCDGVRCDMAMLLLPDVFRRTWGELSVPVDGSAPVDEPFWPEAVTAVRRNRLDFVFMAEVYWGLEYELQQQGFDYTYDKRHYDRLHARDTAGVRGHLHADLSFQRKSARFLENHDERRAADVFAPGMHQAAAILTFMVPGLRFFHDGQFSGRKVHVSMHLGRRPSEPVDPVLHAFYERLVGCLRDRPELRDGAWRMLDCNPAWHDNATSEQFIAFSWSSDDGRRTLVVVNYSSQQGQCLVAHAFEALEGERYTIRDLMGDATYERSREELSDGALYIDLPGWQFNVFDVSPSGDF